MPASLRSPVPLLYCSIGFPHCKAGDGIAGLFSVYILLSTCHYPRYTELINQLIGAAIMKNIGIHIRRHPYEEPYLVNLVFTANNGAFKGQLEYYCDPNDLKDIGMALRDFPKKIPDEYSYEIGSTKSEDNFAHYFALHASTTDRSGHCALQVVIDNNKNRPNEGACSFSIIVEPNALVRLGELLIAFSKLKHREMCWTLSGDGDSLIKDNTVAHWA